MQAGQTRVELNRLQLIDSLTAFNTDLGKRGAIEQFNLDSPDSLSEASSTLWSKGHISAPTFRPKNLEKESLGQGATYQFWALCLVSGFESVDLLSLTSAKEEIEACWYQHERGQEVPLGRPRRPN